MEKVREKKNSTSEKSGKDRKNYVRIRNGLTQNQIEKDWNKCYILSQLSFKKLIFEKTCTKDENFFILDIFNGALTMTGL